jgi:hypothetical protein
MWKCGSVEVAQTISQLLKYIKNTMNKTQQDSAALQFQANWTNRGYEKGESQQFWLDLLSNVFGIQPLSF